MRGRQEQIIVTRPVRTRQSHHMESSRSNSGSTIPTQGEHLYIGELKVEWVEGCHSEWVSLSQEVKWTLSVSWSNGNFAAKCSGFYSQEPWHPLDWSTFMCFEAYSAVSYGGSGCVLLILCKKICSRILQWKHFLRATTWGFGWINQKLNLASSHRPFFKSSLQIQILTVGGFVSARPHGTGCGSFEGPGNHRAIKQLIRYLLDRQMDTNS